MDALLTAFARHLGLPLEAARPTLEGLLDALREGLDREGASTLAGVGRFYQTDGEVAFAPDPALVAAVNAPFAGLPTVTPFVPSPPAEAEVVEVTEVAAEQEEPAPPAADEAPEPEEHEEEEATALFSVPLEAAEPVEDDDELAAPVLDGPPPPPRLAESAEAPIAPVPTAPKVTSEEVPEAPEEEDAFATADGSPPPAPVPEPPLRDLSSGAEPEPPEEEGEPLEAPIAAPYDPADALDGALDGAPEEVLEETLDEPPSAGGEPAGDELPEAEEPDTLEADLEALLAGVWAPSTPPRHDHPLGPATEPEIEDAEYDLVGEQATPEERLEEPEEELMEAPLGEPPVPVEVAPLPPPVNAGREVFEPRTRTPFIPAEEAPEEEPGAPPPPPPRQPTRLRPAERRRSRGLVFWLPLLVALAALVILLLWPRLVEQRPDESAVAPAEPAPAPVTVLPDTAALAAAQDTALTVPPASGPVGEAEAEPEEAPPVATEAPPPEPARPAGAPEAASDGIPAPLRGPGGVDPARGGATWVLGSGSRTGAERDAAHYRRQGFRADVLTGTSSGRTVHRVVVGQFSSFEEALRYRSALPPSAPSSAWVLRL